MKQGYDVERGSIDCCLLMIRIETSQLRWFQD
jgi:hypothetical protein